MNESIGSRERSLQSARSHTHTHTHINTVLLFARTHTLEEKRALEGAEADRSATCYQKPPLQIQITGQVKDKARDSHEGHELSSPFIVIYTLISKLESTFQVMTHYIV